MITIASTIFACTLVALWGTAACGVAYVLADVGGQ